MLGTSQNQQMQDMMNQLMPKRKVEREVPVKIARKILTDDFADELIDQETANQEALELSLIHISEPTRRLRGSRMPSSA